jgi:hypothetical protein
LMPSDLTIRIEGIQSDDTFSGSIDRSFNGRKTSGKSGSLKYVPSDWNARILDPPLDSGDSIRDGRAH